MLVVFKRKLVVTMKRDRQTVKFYFYGYFSYQTFWRLT